MKIRITSAAAAALLLAACQTPPENEKVMRAEEAPAIPGSVQDFKQNVPDRVHFKFDSSVVNHDMEHDLLMQADWLRKYPQMAAVIEGHADERGTTEYNLGLGERRAENAKKFMMANSIPAQRLKTVSYGKERLPAGPAAGASDEDTHKKNRVAVTTPE